MYNGYFFWGMNLSGGLSGWVIVLDYLYTIQYTRTKKKEGYSA